MNALQFPAAGMASYVRGRIASFRYNGKNRIVTIDKVFPSYIIGKDKDGFKSYRFDRMENQPFITVIS